MNNVSAVIFDMDNTLLNTDSLTILRESGNYKNMSQEKLKETHLYPKTNNILEELKKRGIRMGIVTNSPQEYARQILEFHKIEHYFEVVITYNDVGSSGVKPTPNGINLALKIMKLTPSDNILYIGDDYKDVVAAYAAGVKPVAPSWGSKKGITQMPAALLSTAHLLEDLTDFNHIEFIADRCANSRNFEIPKKWLYFAPLDENGNITALDRDKIKIICLGRYFSLKSELTALLNENHELSKEIYKKDSEPNYVIPEYIVQLLSHSLSKIPEYLFNNRNDFDIVTVIPAKKGKNPRLENLLRRLDKISSSKASFIPDIFYFIDGAESLKTLGNKGLRKEAVSKQLKLKEKYTKDIIGKKILVIDDVITTGATYEKAFELLNMHHAEKVLGLCLAKTVSIDEGAKICPKCSCLMRIRNNKNKTVHFWGCTGYFEAHKCTYLENIKIKDCPACGDVMYKKENYKGEIFLACQGYYNNPKCKHTESI